MRITKNKLFFLPCVFCFALSSCGHAESNKSYIESVKIQGVLKFEKEAKKIKYDFDPKTIIPTKERIIDNNGQKREPTLQELSEIQRLLPGPKDERKNNDGSIVHIVIKFESMIVDSWNGQIDLHGSNFTLWEDGLFSGYAKNSSYKGYWYYDDEEKDTIKMVYEFKNAFKVNCHTSKPYEYNNLEFTMIFNQQTALFGYFYKPTIGIMPFKHNNNDVTIEYGPGLFDGNCIFRIDSDLKPFLIHDFTSISRKYNYTGTKYDDGSRKIKVNVEWNSFNTEFYTVCNHSSVHEDYTA